MMRINKKTGSAVAVFIIIEVFLIAFVDRPLANYLHQIDAEYPALINIFRAYTDLGQSRWYLWPCGIGAIFCALAVRQKSWPHKIRERARNAGNVLLFLFATVAVSGIVTDIIKPIVGRARPVMLQRAEFYGFHPFSFGSVWKSMPSGHATTAFALAVSLMMIFPRQRPLWFAFACLVALSRVIVNAHFVSDVIAGAAVGCGVTAVLWQVLTRHGIFHSMKVFFPLTGGGAKDTH